MKRFDRALYNQYDQMAKNGAIRYLQMHGAICIKPHAERYGADVEYHSADGEDGSLEAEVKAVWAGGDFPYPNVNVLHRKTKYFNNGTDLFLMAANGQDWLHITAQDILASPIEEVYNRYVRGGERFYKVALTAARFGRFDTPVDISTPLCQSCGKWVGYGRPVPASTEWRCLGCGHARV